MNIELIKSIILILIGVTMVVIAQVLRRRHYKKLNP